MGNRMSSLPVVQFCGQAARLSAAVDESGRAALMSTAFHAWSNGAPEEETQRLYRRLTDDERAEMDAWQRPADVTVGETRLSWVDAHHEVEVALDARGHLVDAADPAAVSVGHIDGVWIAELNGERVAFVADIKKTKWTTIDGPDSLQLKAYAVAAVEKWKCDAYCCGIWHATEATWSWGPVVDALSLDALDVIADVLAAAQNTSETYATGSHCRSCWSRTRCPAHLLPPDVAHTTLAPFVEGGTITRENVLRVLLDYQRAKDTLEKLGPLLQGAAEDLGGIPDGRGKAWGPVQVKGRESVDAKRLRAELGEGAERFFSRGGAFQQFRWLKEKT